MMPPIAQALAHLLAAFIVLVAPWLGYLQFQRARRRLRAGDLRVKVRIYRQLVAEQIVVTAIVCGLWLFGGIPGQRLGICAPRSLWLTAGLIAVLGGMLVRSALRTRPKALKLRGKLDDSAVGILLPASREEHRWFAGVSVGAGISEELVFRGFLFYYVAVYIPYVNGLELALLTSLVFGMGHLYQGWRGVVKTGAVGLVLAGLYLLTGSVLLPMVIHALIDLQVSFIFWPAATPGAALSEEPRSSQTLRASPQEGE